MLWLNIALDKTLPFPSHSGNATEVEVKNFDQNTGQLVCAVGWKSETDFGKFDATFSYSYMFQKQAVAIISQTNANGKKEYGVGDFLSNKDRRVSIGDLPGIAAIETETEFTDILGMTVKEGVAHLKKEKLNRAQYEIMNTKLPSSSVSVALLFVHCSSVCFLIIRLKHLTKPTSAIRQECANEWMYAFGGIFAQSLYCIFMVFTPAAVLLIGASGIESPTWLNGLWQLACQPLTWAGVPAFLLGGVSILTYFKFLKVLETETVQL